MSVAGISGNSGTGSLVSILKSMSTTATSTSGASSASGSSDSTEISGPAEFLSKLQQLKTQDPDKFKELLTEMAESLKSAAESATSEQDQKMLASLAEKFTSVANGGDLSELEPPRPPTNGMEIYAAGSDSSAKTMGQMMGPQGPPPPGPPPDASGSDASAESSSASDSTTDIRSLLKNLFDRLNERISTALSNSTN